MDTHKILIIDDDVDVINILTTILRHEGYAVESALNKTEGISKAKSFRPDLAIVDVMMNTQYEGFELAKAFSEDAALKKIPVIIQSSIEVFSTNLKSVAEMAIEYRKDPRYKELQVVLLKNTLNDEAAIDYRAEDGSSVWLPVKGFIKKPVDSSRLLPEIKRLLNDKVVA